MATLSTVVTSIIKPALMIDFGVSLTTLIILQNSKKCHVTVANLDLEGYLALVNSIVADYRVVKTFGKDKLQLRKDEWLKEVS